MDTTTSTLSTQQRRSVSYSMADMDWSPHGAHQPPPPPQQQQHQQQHQHLHQQQQQQQQHQQQQQLQLAHNTRSSNGCWTCRLRRKKCDEKRPVCDACFVLHITCNYDADKPEWMDGGVRQEAMAERIKREVKEQAPHRRRERAAHLTPDRMMSPHDSPRDFSAPVYDLLKATPDSTHDGHALFPDTPSTAAAMWPTPRDSTSSSAAATTTVTSAAADGILIGADPPGQRGFGYSDTILFMFYLEHLLPFLFPFYRPSILQGGRAWILEMMISSPVVRQATLCQASYFFSLARGTADGSVAWDRVLVQTRDAFEVLRQSLQVIESSGIVDHLHGAVRILGSIMQVQRFEIAVLSFNNCQAHLSAALALFNQLLNSTNAVDHAGPGACWTTVISCLRPPASWSAPPVPQCLPAPSAEQAAFRFSATLLIFDDVIASTVLQEEPRLYGYHRSLLDGIDPLIDMEAAVGCQNWALLHISEIAALDAWKQQCTRAGSLNVMDLVRRATAIKESLEARLARLDQEDEANSNRIHHPRNTTSSSASASATSLSSCSTMNDPSVDIATNNSNINLNHHNPHSDLLDVFAAEYCRHAGSPTGQTPLVTRVWAHAALLYLFVVVSGWQPASPDVRRHVGEILTILTRRLHPPGLLRTMVWPFCVAGCLAEPALEAPLRTMVDALQPASVFGTVRKALEIMEFAWRHRDSGDVRDLAACFRSQGELVLLV